MILGAGDRIEQNRKEGADEDHEDLAALVDPEPENCQRNPGQRRDRPEQLDDRIEHALQFTPSAHRKAERHRDNGGERPGREHAANAIGGVARQLAIRDAAGRMSVPSATATAATTCAAWRSTRPPTTRRSRRWRRKDKATASRADRAAVNAGPRGLAPAGTEPLLIAPPAASHLTSFNACSANFVSIFGLSVIVQQSCLLEEGGIGIDRRFYPERYCGRTRRSSA